MHSALCEVIEDLLPIADALEDRDDAADREACENACDDRALEECVCLIEILLIYRLIAGSCVVLLRLLIILIVVVFHDLSPYS